MRSSGTKLKANATEAPSDTLLLMSCFSEIRDPRQGNALVHPFQNILVMAMGAVICGAEGWEEIAFWAECKQEWLSTFLDMSAGIPSADTFRRVFSALRPKEFSDALARWSKALAGSLAGEVVAVDGKALRGAMQRAGLGGALHLVHVWACGQRLLLQQSAVEGAPNEEAAANELLGLLELKGAIVTADAGVFSKAFAESILARGAHYILHAKGNRATVHSFLVGFFRDAMESEFKGLAMTHAQSSALEHGRREIRDVWVVPAPREEPALVGVPGVRSLVLVRRIRSTPAGDESAWHYFVSDLPPNANKFLERIRSHWSIENSLHWVLDVQLGEDRSPIHDGYGAENFSTLRKVALTALRREQTVKRGIKARQKLAGWDHDYLLKVLRAGVP